MNVAIACGGTGGHLFPGLAVAETLRAQGHQVLVLISEREIDATAVRAWPEFQIDKIPAVGLPRWNSLQVVSFAGKFLHGLARCRALFRKFRPQAVLGMGGFTSTGPIIAGRLLRLRTYLHESNAIPGKANRLNAQFCDRVLLGFAECAKHFPEAAVEITGTPIRSSLRRPLDRSASLASLNLKPNLQTVLVMGGSQGAHALNQAVLQLLPRFLGWPVQFVHLTGKEDEAAVRDQYRRDGLPAYVSAFYHRMEEVYSVADLAIARSGAASLTEISYFGVPSILIPYPFAAENHQLLNAEIFARGGAAEVIEESRVNGGALAGSIQAILNDSGRRETMRERMRVLAPADAAARIAEVICQSR